MPDDPTRQSENRHELIDRPRARNFLPRRPMLFRRLFRPESEQEPISAGRDNGLEPYSSRGLLLLFRWSFAKLLISGPQSHHHLHRQFRLVRAARKTSWDIHER